MTDVATLQARLTEAEQALHDLALGKRVVEIRHGQNELMRFTPANVAQLRAYAADLRGQLAAAGVSGYTGRARARRVAF